MKQKSLQTLIAFLFCLGSLSGFAQNIRTLTGQVIDQSGIEMPGVNIVEKGTNNGVISDFEGNFSIRVKETSVLVFSYVGLKTVEIPVNNQSVLNITMEDDIQALAEVVVVGYGTQKREQITGAVETINVDEIDDLPAGDLSTTLAGRVLGVGVSGGSTRPGSSASLTIRNPASLSKDGGSTSPLYVIDGVIQIDPNTGFNDNTIFNNLDASEVESISFLKDASAAIYGSRSAQGVVLVTTKKGKKGPARFSYSGSFGVNDESYRTKMMNAYEFGTYYNIMNGPNGYDRTPGDRKYFFTQNELDHFKTLNLNPLDDAWSKSHTQRHNLNVSGGTDDATYFAGVSYYTQDGNLSTLDYDKWTFRAGTDVNLTKGLKATLQLSGYFSDRSQTFNKIGGEKDENDYRLLLNALPFLPQYINGLPAELLGNSQNDNRYHFFEIERLGNLKTNRDNLMTVNMSLEYELPFLKGFRTRASYARIMGNGRGGQIGSRYKLYQFYGPNGKNGEDQYIYKQDGSNTIAKITSNNNGDRIRYSNSNRLSEQYNLNFSYSRDFGKNSLDALFGIEKSEASYSVENAQKDKPLLETNGQFNTAFGEQTVSSSADESGSLSLVGRLNYAFDDKYFAEFLYRSDASAKFAPGNYWGNFYSLSGGWILSRESFFKSNAIDYLKLRASVGLLGKDDTKAWQWRQRYTYQDDKGAVFGGNNNVGVGLKMEEAPNPDAKWSQEVKTNVGVETRLLDNRFSVSAETYYNKGTGLLMAVTQSVPFTVGGTVASQNYGERDSYGYEFSLGWNDNVGKDFRYGVDVNFGWSNDKIIKGDFNDEEILKPWNAKPGESSDNGVWGYDYLGMFRTQDDIDNYVSQYEITQVFGTKAEDLRPGSFYYRDVRGAYLGEGEFAAPDGIIDENDQIRLSKRSSTRYGMGTVIKLGYKSFNLNAVFTASFGGGWSEIDGSARKSLRSDIPRATENRPAIWNNIYDPELNPDGTMPNPAFDGNFERSSFWEVSAFSLSIRNINLSYSLPQKYAEALKINSLKLNLTALNPFILYNPYSYKAPGGPYEVYPLLKTYSLGLNVSF